MVKLALQQPKRHPLHRDKILPWASCAPFVENSRGVLIHRLRSAQTITIHKEPHMAVNYWCGNGVAGKRNLTFLAAPPADKLLCEACERNAVLAGLPSAYELAGRHIHLGKLKAVQTCCVGEPS